MVYFFATLLLFVSPLFSLASPLGAQDVPDAKSKIAAIIPHVNALQTEINNFPLSGGTVQQGLAIHNESVATCNAVISATNAVETITTVSEADAQSILQLAQGLLPPVAKALSSITAKKPGFEHFPIGIGVALVEADLKNLHTNCSALGDVLIVKAPSDIKPNAMALKAQFESAFGSAIAAFASP